MGRHLMKFFSTILSITVLFLGLQANADCHKEGKGKHFFKKMKKELNLTPQQMEQMKSFKKEAKSQFKAKKESMKQARKALESALKSNSSEDVIRARYADLKAQQDEFSQARFEKILKIRAILTEEQRAKFKSSFEHH